MLMKVRFMLCWSGDGVGAVGAMVKELCEVVEVRVNDGSCVGC